MSLIKNSTDFLIKRPKSLKMALDMACDKLKIYVRRKIPDIDFYIEGYGLTIYWEIENWIVLPSPTGKDDWTIWDSENRGNEKYITIEHVKKCPQIEKLSAVAQDSKFYSLLKNVRKLSGKRMLKDFFWFR